MPLVRLNKLLSQTGIASRRSADALILQGRVTLNGQVVTELGTKADPGHDDIQVDGRRIKVGTERRYLLMYKPRSVMSTRSDPQRRRTVIDLLAAKGVKGYFYPVGRLDYDSEGLLLLTNDGDFAERVTHPRYELARTYEALVAGVPDDHDIDRLRRGVIIEGQKTLPAKVRLVRVFESRTGTQALLELTLREGRNRQVRAMCDAVGHPVDRLRRTQIGSLSDRHMQAGDIRDLTPAEIKALMGGASGDAGPAAGDAAARGRASHPHHRGREKQKDRGPHETRPVRDADRPVASKRSSAPRQQRERAAGHSAARAKERRPDARPADPRGARPSGSRPPAARAAHRRAGGARPSGPRRSRG